MKFPTIRATLVRCVALLFCTGLIATGCQTPPPPGLSKEQVTALQEAGFRKEDRVWELGLEGRLLFMSNASKLSDKSRETIARAVKVLKEIGIWHVRIEGYADNTGDTDYNEKLSLRRAEAVAHEMELNGMARRNITVQAFGSGNPVGNNATTEGRAQNRRVAIIIETE